MRGHCILLRIDNAVGVGMVVVGVKLSTAVGFIVVVGCLRELVVHIIGIITFLAEDGAAQV